MNTLIVVVVIAVFGISRTALSSADFQQFVIGTEAKEIEP
jgi:hypothetical protein